MESFVLSNGIVRLMYMQTKGMIDEKKPIKEFKW